MNGKNRTPRIVDGVNVKRKNSKERAAQIKGEALSLLLAANASVPVERRVTPKAAYEVVWRSLNETRLQEFKVRREAALSELDEFLRAAHGDLELAIESNHRDLFSVSHPLSLNPKRFLSSELSIRSAQAAWLSADSTFDASLRPLVASAFSAEAGSAEQVYALTAIRAAGFGEYFEALVAAVYNGGNSFWERSMRARRQRRDRKGRFAFMGGGVRALISYMGDIGQKYSSVSGRVVGFDPKNPNTIDIETPDGQIRRVPVAKTEGVKAVITDPRFPRGLAPVEPKSDEMKNVINPSEIELLDYPAQWSPAGDPQRTSDGDVAQIFNHDSGEFQIARVTKPGGDKSFTVRRAGEQDGQVGEKIGEGSSWADVNDIIKKDVPDSVKKQVKARLDKELGRINPDEDLAELFGEPEELDGDIMPINMGFRDIETQVDNAIKNGDRLAFRYKDSKTGQMKERVISPSKVEFSEKSNDWLVSGVDDEGNFKRFKFEEMEQSQVHFGPEASASDSDASKVEIMRQNPLSPEEIKELEDWAAKQPAGETDAFRKFLEDAPTDVTPDEFKNYLTREQLDKMVKDGNLKDIFMPLEPTPTEIENAPEINEAKVPDGRAPGMPVLNGPDELPAPAGETPIPDGYIRLYHGLRGGQPRDIAAIRSSGKLKAGAETKDDPMVFLTTKPDHYSNGAFVEVAFPIDALEEIPVNTFDGVVPEGLKWFRHPGELSINDSAIAIHEPWHKEARRIVAEEPFILEDLLESSRYDKQIAEGLDLIDNPILDPFVMNQEAQDAAISKAKAFKAIKDSGGDLSKVTVKQPSQDGAIAPDSLSPADAADDLDISVTPSILNAEDLKKNDLVDVEDSIPDLPVPLAGKWRVTNNDIGQRINPETGDPRSLDLAGDITLEPMDDEAREAARLLGSREPEFEGFSVEEDTGWVTVPAGLFDSPVKSFGPADGVGAKTVLAKSSTPAATSPMAQGLIDGTREFGGFTVKPNGFVPTDGIMVSVRETNLHIDADEFFNGGPEVDEKLADWLQANAALLDNEDSEYYIGTWHNTEAGDVVIDVAERFTDRELAIQAGKDRNQEAIYDIGTGELIYTGGTGDREKLQEEAGSGSDSAAEGQEVVGDESRGDSAGGAGDSTGSEASELDALIESGAGGLAAPLRSAKEYLEEGTYNEGDSPEGIAGRLLKIADIADSGEEPDLVGKGDFIRGLAEGILERKRARDERIVRDVEQETRQLPTFDAPAGTHPLQLDEYDVDEFGGPAPERLATVFSRGDLQEAFRDAMENGGYTNLDLGEGEEPVSAEALFFAMEEAGMPAESIARDFYDEFADETGTDIPEAPVGDDEDIAIDGDAPEPSPEEIADVADEFDAAEPTVAADDADVADDVAVDSESVIAAEDRPELLQGLSDEEFDALYNEDGILDASPYLPENETVEFPEGFFEMSPEPYPAEDFINVEEGDEWNQEGFPVGFNNNPFTIAQQFDSEDLQQALFDAIDPDNPEPGFHEFVFENEDGDELRVLYPAELIRDALQLQGVDTNELLNNYNAEYREENDIPFEAPEPPEQPEPSAEDMQEPAEVLTPAEADAALIDDIISRNIDQIDFDSSPSLDYITAAKEIVDAINNGEMSFDNPTNMDEVFEITGAVKRANSELGGVLEDYIIEEMMERGIVTSDMISESLDEAEEEDSDLFQDDPADAPNPELDKIIRDLFGGNSESAPSVEELVSKVDKPSEIVELPVRTLPNVEGMSGSQKALVDDVVGALVARDKGLITRREMDERIAKFAAQDYNFIARTFADEKDVKDALRRIENNPDLFGPIQEANPDAEFEYLNNPVRRMNRALRLYSAGKMSDDEFDSEILEVLRLNPRSVELMSDEPDVANALTRLKIAGLLPKKLDDEVDPDTGKKSKKPTGKRSKAIKDRDVIDTIEEVDDVDTDKPSGIRRLIDALSDIKLPGRGEGVGPQNLLKPGEKVKGLEVHVPGGKIGEDAEFTTPDGDSGVVQSVLLPRPEGAPQRIQVVIRDADGNILKIVEVSTAEEAEAMKQQLAGQLAGGDASLERRFGPLGGLTDDDLKNMTPEVREFLESTGQDRVRIIGHGNKKYQKWSEDNYVDATGKIRIVPGDRVRHFYDGWYADKGEGVVLGYETVMNPGDRSRKGYVFVGFADGTTAIWATDMLFVEGLNPSGDRPALPEKPVLDPKRRRQFAISNRYTILRGKRRNAAGKSVNVVEATPYISTDSDTWKMETRRAYQMWQQQVDIVNDYRRGKGLPVLSADDLLNLNSFVSPKQKLAWLRAMYGEGAPNPNVRYATPDNRANKAKKGQKYNKGQGTDGTDGTSEDGGDDDDNNPPSGGGGGGGTPPSDGPAGDGTLSQEQGDDAATSFLNSLYDDLSEMATAFENGTESTDVGALFSKNIDVTFDPESQRFAVSMQSKGTSEEPKIVDTFSVKDLEEGRKFTLNKVINELNRAATLDARNKFVSEIASNSQPDVLTVNSMLPILGGMSSQERSDWVVLNTDVVASSDRGDSLVSSAEVGQILTLQGFVTSERNFLVLGKSYKDKSLNVDPKNVFAGGVSVRFIDIDTGVEFTSDDVLNLSRDWELKAPNNLSPDYMGKLSADSEQAIKSHDEIMSALDKLIDEVSKTPTPLQKDKKAIVGRLKLAREEMAVIDEIGRDAYVGADGRLANRYVEALNLLDAMTIHPNAGFFAKNNANLKALTNEIKVLEARLNGVDSTKGVFVERVANKPAVNRQDIVANALNSPDKGNSVDVSDFPELSEEGFAYDDSVLGAGAMSDPGIAFELSQFFSGKGKKSLAVLSDDALQALASYSSGVIREHGPFFKNDPALVSKYTKLYRAARKQHLEFNPNRSDLGNAEILRELDFDRLWREMEFRNLGDIEEIQDEDGINTGLDMIVIANGAIGQTLLIIDQTTGQKFIMKREQTVGTTDSEIFGAAILNQMGVVGANYAVRSKKDKNVFISTFSGDTIPNVGEGNAIKYVGWGDDEKLSKAVNQADIGNALNVFLFDILTGNPDRHPENFKLVRRAPINDSDDGVGDLLFVAPLDAGFAWALNKGMDGSSYQTPPLTAPRLKAMDDAMLMAEIESDLFNMTQEGNNLGRSMVNVLGPEAASEFALMSLAELKDYIQRVGFSGMPSVVKEQLIRKIDILEDMIPDKFEEIYNNQASVLIPSSIV